MLALCIRAVIAAGRGRGIAFYLVPDFGRLFANGWSTFGDAVYAAMGQAFLQPVARHCGPWKSRFAHRSPAQPDRRGHSVTALNTVVAILAGLIIFPACFCVRFARSGTVAGFDAAGGVRADAAWQRGLQFFPVLRVHGVRVAVHRHRVFENLISWSMDKRAMRSRAVIFNAVLVLVLSHAVRAGLQRAVGRGHPGYRGLA